jgi:hypothetical protein
VPYFELVGKLESRKLEIASDEQSIKAEILSRQAEIAEVKREIEVFLTFFSLLVIVSFVFMLVVY